MGLINKLRNKTNNQMNKEQSHEMIKADIARKQDGTVISIFYPEVKYNVTHRDGEITKIITGKIVIFKPGDTIMPEYGAPACFEIPIEMDIQEVINSGLFQEFENIGFFDKLSYDQYNILGKINFQENNWSVEPFSNTVLQNIDKLNMQLQQDKGQTIEERNKQLHMQIKNVMQQQRDRKAEYLKAQQERAEEDTQYNR